MRELCRHCDDLGVALQELPLDDYQRFSPLFENDVYGITAEASAAARDIPGGTAPNRVAEALARANRILEESKIGATG
jgi:argininosuccinate lyase